MFKPVRLTNKSFGFTLIELLVVISIIGLLASVILVSLNTTRLKARDAKRIADLNQISKAMELYAADHNGQYPQADDAYSVDWSNTCGGPIVNGGPGVSPQSGCGWCNRWCWLMDTLKPYMSQMPKDPLNDSAHYYYYNSPSAGNSKYYGLGANLFEDNSNAPKLSNPNGIYPSGYELGPEVNYCLGKYSGANASWHWNSNYTLCAGGN